MLPKDVPLLSDLRTLRHIVFASAQGRSHAERLESFYRTQAADYDRFRKKLLPGREEFFGLLADARGRWVDLGCGTAESLQIMSKKRVQLTDATLVDLCPALLAKARARAHHSTIPAAVVEADASSFRVTGEAPRLVTFCYSLSMMPDWIEVLENAYDMLAPGGTLAVLDFYVSRKYAAPGYVRHGWWRRSILPLWFAQDNVFLRPDVLPWLARRLAPVYRSERLHKIPYLLGISVPYFLFIGTKPPRSNEMLERESCT